MHLLASSALSIDWLVRPFFGNDIIIIELINFYFSIGLCVCGRPQRSNLTFFSISLSQHIIYLSNYIRWEPPHKVTTKVRTTSFANNQMKREKKNMPGHGRGCVYVMCMPRAHARQQMQKSSYFNLANSHAAAGFLFFLSLFSFIIFRFFPFILLILFMSYDQDHANIFGHQKNDILFLWTFNSMYGRWSLVYLGVDATHFGSQFELPTLSA